MYFDSSLITHSSITASNFRSYYARPSRIRDCDYTMSYLLPWFPRMLMLAPSFELQKFPWNDPLSMTGIVEHFPLLCSCSNIRRRMLSGEKYRPFILTTVIVGMSVTRIFPSMSSSRTSPISFEGESKRSAIDDWLKRISVEKWIVTVNTNNFVSLLVKCWPWTDSLLGLHFRISIYSTRMETMGYFHTWKVKMKTFIFLTVFWVLQAPPTEYDDAVQTQM